MSTYRTAIPLPDAYREFIQAITVPRPKKVEEAK